MLLRDQDCIVITNVKRLAYSRHFPDENLHCYY